MLRLLIFVAGIAFAIWTVSTSLTQVGPGERAVVRRFGRILENKPLPGLYIGWPWGIDRVERENVGLVRPVTVGYTGQEDRESEALPAGQLLTGDHNLVNVKAEIQYKIREADVAAFVLQKDNIEAFLTQAAQTLLAEWIAARRVDDVLRRGKIELPAFLHAHLDERLADYALGVEIEQASITKLEPPEQVKEAFERLTQAETNIRTRRNEAEEKAGRQLSDMASRIYEMQRQAAAYAKEQRDNAQADASGFRKRLDQYRELSRRDPDYLNVLWLDEMTRLYAGMRAAGRVESLDHFLTKEGLSITQFPLVPRKR